MGRHHNSHRDDVFQCIVDADIKLDGLAFLDEEKETIHRAGRRWNKYADMFIVELLGLDADKAPTGLYEMPRHCRKTSCRSPA